MNGAKVIDFQSVLEKVGKFNVRDKILLIPEMNRIGSHLLAAVFRSFGINARVMETYKGLELGKEYTSGKECYPCQITTGDILYFLESEKKRLKDKFDPKKYVYFMPESNGPCRFGMYNKYQRIVLDSFSDFRDIKIATLSTADGYSLAGLIEEDRVKDLRKVAYWSIVVGDIMDRLLWRIRPYEKEEGMTDDFIEDAMHRMEDVFERYGQKKDLNRIMDHLDEIISEGKEIIDPRIPLKPKIGIVGEIYVRTHVHANQHIIKMLEKYGAECVNASISEWVNYTTYDRLRDAKIGFRLSVKQWRLRQVKEYIKEMMHYRAELFYQEMMQEKIYKRARSILDISEDHRIGHLEEILKEEDIYSFDAGTEACLSIPTIIHYVREGFNGVVNVYPFTCMPSTITSAVIRPIIADMKVPYLDAPYDSSVQPGRESAIRTFMYQAFQHFKRNGRPS
ncbi:MAG: CoA activase [Candidatus Aenigmatarchaeota archaeon]|nr:MAG: CoA activase [Candidatus Aenigmarchaeota archaeon]